MSGPVERIGARTTLQKLLSRFHFGITLFAVALSGVTILLAGVTALRGYADRNMELAAQLGAYGVEPALVFNDSVAAREGIDPLTRIPGIVRLRVLDHVGKPVTEWISPAGDPAPLLSRAFFPRPFAVTVRRNGSAIGTVEVWGDSSTLIDYVRLGLLAGLGCLLVTALGTIFLARRFEYELVKPLNEIATVAHDVRLHRRFDKRVKPLGIAELDRLGGDINALLDELQGWQGHMESERALLAHRASHDTLTALPNRAAFDEQLALRIAAASARDGQFALLFIDATISRRRTTISVTRRAMPCLPRWRAASGQRCARRISPRGSAATSSSSSSTPLTRASRAPIWRTGCARASPTPSPCPTADPIARR